MGKTYRKEKTFKPRPKRLNTHRDLPDYTPFVPDEEEAPTEEDYNYGKALRPSKQSDKQAKD